HSSNEPLLNTLLRVPEIDWGVKKSAHRAPTPGNQRLPFTMSPRLCRHRLRRATHCRIRPLTLSDWTVNSYSPNEVRGPSMPFRHETSSISVFRGSWENKGKCSPRFGPLSLSRLPCSPAWDSHR